MSSILALPSQWPSQFCSNILLAKTSAKSFQQIILAYQKNGIFRDLQNNRVVLGAVSRKVKMPLLDAGDSLYRRLSRLGDPSLDAVSVLQQWVDEGRKASRWNLQGYVKKLRKYSRYQHALQVSEWIASRENYRLSPSDCAIRLDLIAKVHGIRSAENYFQGLPDTAKNKLTYGALLNAYAKENLVEKAETIMEKIQRSGYAASALNYNVIMNLYINTRQFEKVPLVIQKMRDNGVPLDAYSYNIWITTCAAMSDVVKMEQVMDEVKHDNNVNTNWTIYSTLATMYTKFGLIDKAEFALDEVKSKMRQTDRSAYEYLISQYASIGNKDRVYRSWQSLKSAFPKILNRSYIFMLSSLVKIGDIEGAEEIFKEWEPDCATYDVRIANIILGVYVRNKLLEKAEILIQHISERGVKLNFNSWEILAEGYIQTGNFEKAVLAMNNAASVGKVFRWKPKPANVIAILTYFQNLGDVESAKKFFEMLRELTYVDIEMYHSLLPYTEAGKTDSGIVEHIRKS